MADFNRLEEYDLIARTPYVQPRYFPFVPPPAERFEVYMDVAAQQGVTTLNTYVAPLPPRYNDYYQTGASQGNGIVFAGNAPTDGVYTGIQQE